MNELALLLNSPIPTEYEIKRAGTYRITYVAEDEYGNVSAKIFIVTAEEK